MFPLMGILFWDKKIRTCVVDYFIILCHVSHVDKKICIFYDFAINITISYPSKC